MNSLIFFSNIMGLSITPFLTLFFVVMIYHLLLLILNCLFPIFFFLHQIANVFGPAFLLKLYVGGALTGSVFFLLEKAFLAHRKQVRMHDVLNFVHQDSTSWWGCPFTVNAEISDKFRSSAFENSKPVSFLLAIWNWKKYWRLIGFHPHLRYSDDAPQSIHGISEFLFCLSLC